MPLPGLTPQMEAALLAPAPLITLLLEVILPDRPLRLCFGATKVPAFGEDFIGRDPDYGTWLSSDAIGDGIGDEVPAVSLQFAPPTTAAVEELNAPEVQGSPTRIWFCVIDRATGGVVPDPYLLLDGELDQPTVTRAANALLLDYDVVSSLERLFNGDEGRRLSDAFQQQVFPGERGLEHMTGLVRTIIWGPGSKPAGLTTGGSGGGYSGGGFLGALLERVMNR